MRKTLKFVYLRYQDPNIQLLTIGLLLFFGPQLYASYLLSGPGLIQGAFSALLLIGLMVYAPWRIAAVLGTAVILTFIIDAIWGFHVNRLLTAADTRIFIERPIHSLAQVASIMKPGQVAYAMYFIVASIAGFYMSLRYRYTNYRFSYTVFLAVVLCVAVYADILGSSAGSITFSKVLYALFG